MYIFTVLCGKRIWLLLQLHFRGLQPTVLKLERGPISKSSDYYEQTLAHVLARLTVSFCSVKSPTRGKNLTQGEEISKRIQKAAFTSNGTLDWYPYIFSSYQMSGKLYIFLVSTLVPGRLTSEAYNKTPVNYTITHLLLMHKKKTEDELNL